MSLGPWRQTGHRAPGCGERGRRLREAAGAWVSCCFSNKACGTQPSAAPSREMGLTGNQQHEASPPRRYSVLKAHQGPCDPTVPSTDSPVRAPPMPKAPEPLLLTLARPPPPGSALSCEDPHAGHQVPTWKRPFRPRSFQRGWHQAPALSTPRSSCLC